MRLPFGFQLKRSERNPKLVKANWDAAQTTIENELHWAAADALSPDAAASPESRRTLRIRSRYEVKNNSFARGIVNTIANDTIGRGPRLRILTSEAKEIEFAWKQWCVDTRFCQKLRTMRMAKIVDGECVARLVNNMRLNGVKLDIQLYEADMLSDPFYRFIDVIDRVDQELVDGIELDAKGNPLRYYLWRVHPGAHTASSSNLFGEGDWVRRERVIHLFREDRPGLHRGIPELTPALPLFAMLRRYSLSTVAAAETAADLAAVLKTESAAFNGQDADDIDFGVSFPIRRRTIMALPFGWEIQQMKAEQPTTTYREFRDALLMEIARCLSVPFNVALGNSADYNYASGRLDHQTYFRAIDIERDDFVNHAINPIFETWLREYLAVRSGIRPSDIDVANYPHKWYWDPHPHVDPTKEASAVSMLWDKGLLSDEDYLMAHGKDPEDHYTELQTMIEIRKPLNLPLPGVAAQMITTETADDESATTSTEDFE